MISKKQIEFTLLVAVCLSFITFISGCATGPKIPTPDLSSLPKCDIDGNTHVGGPQYALLDMSESRIGQIRLIDGKPFKPKDCDYLHVVVPPGKHTVYLFYMKSLYLLYPRGRDPVSFNFNAESGKTYRIVVTKHPLKSLYNCRFEEAATGEILQEIDDCDRDEVRRPAMQEVLDLFGGRDAYLEYKSEWWPDKQFEALHKHLRQ
jgi:hypothetical protein